jgi:hypothetical protein
MTIKPRYVHIAIGVMVAAVIIYFWYRARVANSQAAAIQAQDASTLGQYMLASGLTGGVANSTAGFQSLNPADLTAAQQPATVAAAAAATTNGTGQSSTAPSSLGGSGAIIPTDQSVTPLVVATPTPTLPVHGPVSTCATTSTGAQYCGPMEQSVGSPAVGSGLAA